MMALTLVASRTALAPKAPLRLQSGSPAGSRKAKTGFAATACRGFQWAP